MRPRIFEILKIDILRNVLVEEWIIPRLEAFRSF